MPWFFQTYKNRFGFFFFFCFCSLLALWWMLWCYVQALWYVTFIFPSAHTISF
jgi:IS4 transposase